MTESLIISDGGSASVSLISDTGFEMLYGGWRPQTPQLRPDIVVSPLADGGKLKSVRRSLILERIRCQIVGTSHDNLASQMQTLDELLVKAANYHTTGWQTTPVYLQAQYVNESNTRYSPIFWGQSQPRSSIYERATRQGNLIRDVEIQVQRDPFWQSHAPGSSPTALTLTAVGDAPANASTQYVVPWSGSNSLSHIWVYEEGTGFSANQISSSAFDYFPDPSSASDAAYFGSDDGPFHNLILNIGTARSGGDLSWQYSNSASGWSAVGGALEDPSSTLSASGEQCISAFGWSDWTAACVNDVQAHYLRAVTSSSMSTVPAQTSHVCYVARQPYIEVAADQVDGDVDALARFILENAGTSSENISWHTAKIFFGLKSRGLNNFTAFLNATGQNPTGWSSSYGTDTSSVAETRSPIGTFARCTFTTDQTLQQRVALTLDTGVRAKDFIGTYQVYLLYQHSAGTAGEVTCKVLTYIDQYIVWRSESVDTLASGDPFPSVLDMGRLRLPPADQVPDSDTWSAAANALKFLIQASATSAAEQLDIMGIVLMPIDEWAGSIVDPVRTDPGGDKTAQLESTRQLDVDGGILRKRVTISGPSGYTRGMDGWELRARWPELPPDKQMRIYFMLMKWPSTFGVGPQSFRPGMRLRASVYCHERWHGLRGAD